MITSVLSELTAFTSRKMMESVYTSLFYLMLCLAPLVFAILFWVPAPYGRYVRPGWGPIVNNRLGWFFMESPASLLMLIPLYFLYENIVVCIFLFIWQFHYVHRAFFYPFTLKSERNIPLLIIVMAFFFNVVNAYLNGFYLSLSNAFIFTIVFGLIIDDSIHLISAYANARKRKISKSESMDLVVSKTGDAILKTTLIVIICLFPLSLSEFKSVSQLSVITILSAFIAVFFDLVYLPLIIKRLTK